MKKSALVYPAFDPARVAPLQQAWRSLCEQYLPFAPPDTHWRFNRVHNPQDPEQGWKLHLPATVLNAGRLLERIAPVLQQHGVQFKAPASLQELQRLNTGLYYGYSQIGKCVTVYPRTPAEALSLAECLHELTAEFAAPAVPFDLRLREGSNVYYRYGAFRPMTLTASDGNITLALRDPSGRLVPDEREIPMPGWVLPPFPVPHWEKAPNDSPLKTTYKVCRALTQRGKGGVYLALDLRMHPPRQCVLKEGRRHGEVSWDGRDGHWRVQREAQVLSELAAIGLDVPRVYDSFELGGNFYLVTEWIEGVNWHAWLSRRQRRLSLASALRYGQQVAALLERLHAADWVWRDCKPANLMLTSDGRLRPLDFEGACQRTEPDALAWCTPAFAPAATQSQHPAQASYADDLYALGAVLYFLVTGRTPTDTLNVPARKLRRNVPASVCDLIADLLHAAPHLRPAAATVAEQLSVWCNDFKGQVAN